MTTGPRVGLILGGGGVVTVAWELGVLAALKTDSGWDPATATVVVGTSAGAVSGAITALGRDLVALVDERSSDATVPEIPAGTAEAVSLAESALPAEVAALYAPGNGDAVERARALGRFAVETTAAVFDADFHRSVVAAELGTDAWPDTDLRVTTTDCGTGETVLLDRHSGVDLVSAVCASSALPTYFPVVRHAGRALTDGPRGPFITPLVDELRLDAVVFVGLRFPGNEGIEHMELDALAARGTTIARVTNGPTYAAVGTTPMDFAATGTAAAIGRHDGRQAAERVRQALSEIACTAV